MTWNPEKKGEEDEKRKENTNNLKMPSGSKGARHHPGESVGRGP